MPSQNDMKERLAAMAPAKGRGLRLSTQPPPTPITPPNRSESEAEDTPPSVLTAINAQPHNIVGAKDAQSVIILPPIVRPEDPVSSPPFSMDNAIPPVPNPPTQTPLTIPIITTLLASPSLIPSPSTQESSTDSPNPDPPRRRGRPLGSRRSSPLPSPPADADLQESQGVRVGKSLLKACRHLAIDREVPLYVIFNEALAEYLYKHSRPPTSAP